MAPVFLAMLESATLDPVVVVTGQHREMLDQVNKMFQINPAHDLKLMVPGATLDELASRALTGVSVVLREERPDAILIQGDTSTAFISGLAAFYQQIPVIHLEAGLRTHTILTPFPEEANRQLATRITNLHLAPTQTSRSNLLAENVPEADIAITGNTVIDALYRAVSVPVEFADPRVARTVQSEERYVLVTAHRRESWGQSMRTAMEGLRDAALKNRDIRWLVPMHPNPVVRDVITDVLGSVPGAQLIEPLTYHEFCHAMKSAHLIVTDSGGVQEEAPSLGKPVLVMRESTERPEAVDAGTVALVGTSRAVVAAQVNSLLDDQSAYDRMANAVNPYGDGFAAGRAISAIEAMFGLGTRAPDFHPLVQGIN